MDLAPTAEQSAFRAECRGWLKNNVEHPPSGASLDETVAWGRAWQRRLADGGLVGISWPVEYGGRGLGPLHHFVAQEELARTRAPELVGRIGLNLVAPTLLAHGTEEQKRRWLPAILDASELWCQLFSEPEAGSDLAGLSTRADDVDGGSAVTGQKVWTSYAQFADWGLCLARTRPLADAPKHHGLSMLVVDMHSPGVEVRPLRQLTGDAEFNEVFFNGVFVPHEHLVGGLHEGWAVSAATLAFERGVNPRQLVIHIQRLEELLELANQRDLFDDPVRGPRLAQAFVEVKLFQLHNWRSLSRLARGDAPRPEGSVLKLYWSEMSKRLHETALAALGPDEPLWGDWQRAWLYYQAASIFAGTNEIQRNIIGERVLGLPR